MDRTRRTATGSTRTRALAALAALSAGLMTIAAPTIAHAKDDDNGKGNDDKGAANAPAADDGAGKGNGNGGGHTPVTLCHATGNGGFVVITVDDDGATRGHSQHAGDIIPAPAGGCPVSPPAPASSNDEPKHEPKNEPKNDPASSPAAPVNAPAGTPKDAPKGAPQDKVVVCHLTGNGGFVVIEIARGGWANGHSKHEGDVLLADANGSCPVAVSPPAAPASAEVPASAAPAPSAAPESTNAKDKVTLCHMKGNGGYVKITIAEAGWENGHSKHEGDIVLTDITAECPAAAAAPGTPVVAPAVEAGAPNSSTNPTKTHDKLTICHIKGNGGFVKITIARAGWDNGHSKHEGDVILTDVTVDCASAAAIGAAATTPAATPAATPVVTPAVTPAVTPGAAPAATPSADAPTSAVGSATTPGVTPGAGASSSGSATGSATEAPAAAPVAPAGAPAAPSGQLSQSLSPLPADQAATAGAVLSPVAAPSAAVAPAAPAAPPIVAADDGSLPETGSDVGIILTIGALAAIAGLAFLAAGRRRAHG
jgi:LPXTG-motif cell wall-anchored protein